MYGTTVFQMRLAISSAPTVNTFKYRLDKFLAEQDVFLTIIKLT